MQRIKVLQYASWLLLFALSAVSLSADAGVQRAPGYHRPELYFEANHGQIDDDVHFIARAPGYQLLLTTEAAWLKLLPSSDNPQAAIRLSFPGALPSPPVAASDALDGIVNYFVGSDRTQWRTNIPTYTAVRQALYPGVELIYRNAQQDLEFDFVIAPGSDSDQIALQFEGIDTLEIAIGGDLILHVGDSELRLRAPHIYQDVGGERRFVRGGYVQHTPEHIGFWVEAYDVTRPLVIDPVLLYSTYLGGEEEDSGRAIAADDAGNAYVTGQAHTASFPTTPGVFQPVSDDDFNFDVFVSKLSPDGSALVFSTFLGGDWWDTGSGIAVDETGNVYVAGSTDSSDFPTVNALQAASAGDWDSFVAKLNPDGSDLLFSTHLGGTDYDLNNAGIALDAAGNIYVAGHTRSIDFPTANAFQDSKLGVNAAVVSAYDAFVSKLRNDGSGLIYSTYFGGREEDCRWACAVTVDASGAAYLAGSTSSTEISFPLVNALQPTLGGTRDGFVAKFSPEGDALDYSTFFGGTDADQAEGIVVDETGSAYVVGQTESMDLATTAGSFQTSLGGPTDAFVAKLTPDGGGLDYSTFLGGSSTDRGFEIALDDARNAYVTGFTGSDDFPIVDPVHDFQSSDAFVALLNAAGDALLFSTFLGGEQTEVGTGITVDPTGAIYVVGYSVSTDFPTLNPFQPTIGGHFDAFVAKFAPFQREYRYEYATKIVCGPQADPEDMRLARGFYATTINVHNPGPTDASFFKKLALTFPPAEQQPGEIIPIAEHTLRYDEALAVDCMDLLREIFPEGFPTPYIEGFIVIQSDESLDVTAVYTTAALNNAGRATTHSSIDVVQVEERIRNNGADIEVQKRAEQIGLPSSVNLVRYTVDVTNHGPEDATNITVSDSVTVDVGTLLDVPAASFTATHGPGWVLQSMSPTAAELEATIPLLEPGEMATLEFTILVMLDLDVTQAYVVNVTSIESSAPDSNPNNNSDSVETVIVLG